ncbi:unnamed protein product [marine sediment metagenome]|uniref:J domain-containing protein n=1 Tax=marine sediment metagenome TaxID=412755 RepID=X1BIM2_9ZZZZ
MQTQFNIQELLARLELPLSVLNGLQMAGSIPGANKELKNFKELIKQKRKDLAKRYHPDKGGEEERMKEINNICDWILGSEITPIPIQPVVRYYSYFGSTSSGNDTATGFYS